MGIIGLRRIYMKNIMAFVVPVLYIVAVATVIIGGGLLLGCKKAGVI